GLVSAFGSIIALNRTVDGDTAVELAKLFVEAVIAPDYRPEALSIFAPKKNLRVLSINGLQSGDPHPSLSQGEREIKRISGGILLQDVDNVLLGPESRIVTKRRPTENEHRDLHFAWRVAKNVKSNAIVLAEVVQAADEHGIAMIFTGLRHFKH